MACLNLLDLSFFGVGCASIDEEQTKVDDRVINYYNTESPLRQEHFPAFRSSRTVKDYSFILDEMKRSYISRSDDLDEVWVTDSICESRDDCEAEQQEERQESSAIYGLTPSPSQDDYPLYGSSTPSFEVKYEKMHEQRQEKTSTLIQ